MASLVLLAAGCGGAGSAGAPFAPVQPDVLTVATATQPAPGFWEGTPPRAGFEAALADRLAAKVLIVTSSDGPSDESVRAATLLARPDGGSSDLLITRPPTESPPATAHLRAIERRICRHGFEGHIRTAVGDVSDAVEQALLEREHSLVIADEPAFEHVAGHVPVVVVGAGPHAERVVADETDGSATEIGRRLAHGRRHERIKEPA